MGARGSSSGRMPPTPPPTPPPKPAPIRLKDMNDTQLSSFIDNAMKANMPSTFHDDLTQRMIFAANWNDKPEVVTSDKVEAEAKIPGTIVLYRTNRTNGYATGKQYSDGFRADDQFSTGGWGGQLYGGGMYFSSSLRGSKKYGDKNRVNPSNTIGAVLNQKARVVSMDDLEGTLGKNWLKKHPAAARAMGFSSGSSLPKHRNVSYTALAMAMGYNVVSNKISTREKYYTVLDRSALTTSGKDYYFASKGMK